MTVFSFSAITALRGNARANPVMANAAVILFFIVFLSLSVLPDQPGTADGSVRQSGLVRERGAGVHGPAFHLVSLLSARSCAKSTGDAAWDGARAIAGAKIRWPTVTAACSARNRTTGANAPPLARRAVRKWFARVAVRPGAFPSARRRLPPWQCHIDWPRRW